MAFKTKFVFLMFMLVLLFLVAVVVVEQASAGCYAEQRCVSPKLASSLEIQSRKVLQVVSKGVTGNGDELVVGELRTAPSGPDPLHHNGATPKKPTP